MTEPDHTAALRVPDAPAIPLARTVAMPDGLDFPTGTLHFRITDLAIHPTGTPDGTTLAPLDITASYVVEATRDDIATHDGGGDLSELPDSATAPNDGYQPTDQEREEWTTLARDHRTRLEGLKNPNADKLLATYNDHEEIYGDLFDPNKSTFVKKVWRNPKKPDTNTSAEMSRDTHAAVTGQKTVNPQVSERSYVDWDGKQSSYNAASFHRAGGVIANIPYLDPDYVPGKVQPKQRYLDAIAATGSFNDNVQTHTGNRLDTTVPLTSEQVYGVIQHPDTRFVDSGRDWATAAVHPFADDVWEGFDDDERDLVRAHHRVALHARAERLATATPHELFSGTATARVTNAVVTTAEDGRVTVTVPPLELAVDDSAWSGAGADVARERLGDLGFLADILRDAIRERLRRAAVDGDPRAAGTP